MRRFVAESLDSVNCSTLLMAAEELCVRDLATSNFVSSSGNAKTRKLSSSPPRLLHESSSFRLLIHPAEAENPRAASQELMNAEVIFKHLPLPSCANMFSRRRKGVCTEVVLNIG